MALETIKDFLDDLRGRINEITPDAFSDKILEHWLQLSYWYILKKLAPILGDRLMLKITFSTDLNKIILTLAPATPDVTAIYLDGGDVTTPDLVLTLGALVIDGYPAKRLNIADYNGLQNNSFYSADADSPIFYIHDNQIQILPLATSGVNQTIELYYIPRTDLLTAMTIPLPEEYRDLVLYYAEILTRRRFNKPVGELETALSNMIKEFYDLYGFEVKKQELVK